MTPKPLLLVRAGEVFAPERLGSCSLLMAGDRLLACADPIDLPSHLLHVLDAPDTIAVPGFIDGHVHLLGGGGEGGWGTRTPELRVEEAVLGGLTTVVGCLGTDGVTRSLPALLAKARSLEAEGLSTFLFTGSYAVPPVTLTGDVERDLLLIDKVIGAGEIAVSDHRSAQPTGDELARLAGACRRGGMLSGKAGILMLHLGDGPKGLEPLQRLLAETEIPRTQLLPTHVNRNPRLLEAATGYALEGGWVDLTTSGSMHPAHPGPIPAPEALRMLLDQGVPPGSITMTSDGQGSLPVFDTEGRLAGLEVGSVRSLHGAFREAVLGCGVALEPALRTLTSTPARVLGLRDRGRIAPGLRADLTLLDRRTLEVRSVIAGGRILMEDGILHARSTYA